VTLNAWIEREFARLRSFYREGEIVGLMASIGLSNYGDGATQPALAEELATAAIKVRRLFRFYG
jgi:hypothetical protein